MKIFLQKAIVLKKHLDGRSNREVLVLIAVTTFMVPVPGASLPILIYAGHRWSTRFWVWVAVQLQLLRLYFANRIFCMRHSLEDRSVAFSGMPGLTSPWRDPAISRQTYGDEFEGILGNSDPA